MTATANKKTSFVRIFAEETVQECDALCRMLERAKVPFKVEVAVKRSGDTNVTRFMMTWEV